jgi:hypothetical protein
VKTSSKASLKSISERHVFSQFAKAVNWPCDGARIESRSPPEPDILYHSPDEKIAFELVENAAQMLAHDTAKLVDRQIEELNWYSDPSKGTIKAKLKKKYVSDYPIELLCYAGTYVITPEVVATNEIKTLLQSVRHNQFRRVWYFGANNDVTLVWERSS